MNIKLNSTDRRKINDNLTRLEMANVCYYFQSLNRIRMVHFDPNDVAPEFIMQEDYLED